MMDDLEQHLLGPSATVEDAIRAIDSNRAKIVLVVDDDRRLLGTVTDGDIRRALIRGIDLERSVEEVMNRHPTVASVDADQEQTLALMRINSFLQMPLVDRDGIVVGVETLTDLLEPGPRDNPIVLMVGGRGTRLKPLTDDRPKPLLPVGPKPLLETVIEGFVTQGFHRFFLCVNYRADMIREQFGNGERFGVTIDYVEEPEPLGTAGALSLLPPLGNLPMIVMNGDLLTKLNYGGILDFHVLQRAAATVAVRDFVFEVPYGVVEVHGDEIKTIREKPEFRNFVNAGIYVLNAEVVGSLGRGRPVDMPDVIGRLLSGGRRVAAYPIREYWLDIGRPDDLHRADEDFEPRFRNGT
jgi:dTDP-glucose pyrophosphorylase